MRMRLFQLIFKTSIMVCMVCVSLLGGWVIVDESEVGFLRLFVPLLVVIVLAIALSLILADVGSRSFMRPFDKIDILGIRNRMTAPPSTGLIKIGHFRTDHSHLGILLQGTQFFLEPIFRAQIIPVHPGNKFSRRVAKTMV